jgi:hypothetical protein
VNSQKFLFEKDLQLTANMNIGSLMMNTEIEEKNIGSSKMNTEIVKKNIEIEEMSIETAMMSNSILKLYI